MNTNENLIMLCEGCINALKKALETDGLPMSVNMTLNQKLFLLETGLEELKNSEPQTADCGLQTADCGLQTADCQNPTAEPQTADTPLAELQAHYLQNADNSLKEAVAEFEKDLIQNAVAEHGSKRKAATALHIDHSTLIKKCQRYGI